MLTLRCVSWCLLCTVTMVVSADESLVRQATETMRAAAEYYRNKVASHGGYVYYYSSDLSDRYGEGVATNDQIWVQPPGTPTVGMAYLSALAATGDAYYLESANETARALLYGQLKSGGWNDAIDFDPQGAKSGLYRNGKASGKNNSSLDDGKTQSAIQFLVRLDEANRFNNADVHEAVTFALDALLKAQFANGAFPQVWTGPVESVSVVRASYPDHDWRTEGRIKEYWDQYTLNDDVAGYTAQTLIEAYRVYGDRRYLQALRNLGDFLLLAQMPDPQPGYAQQYNRQMQPIWARKFEPAAIASDETQEALAALMLIAEVTGDKKYLRPIPAAIDWLKRSRLPDGQLARYYELKTNRPLYMIRRGDLYTLTYDDSDLPKHYGWKISSKIESLEKRFAKAKLGKPLGGPKSLSSLTKDTESILASFDGSERWLDTFDGTRAVGQLKLPVGAKYLSSRTFSDNLTTLSQFLIAAESSAADGHD